MENSSCSCVHDLLYYACYHYAWRRLHKIFIITYLPSCLLKRVCTCARNFRWSSNDNNYNNFSISKRTFFFKRLCVVLRAEGKGLNSNGPSLPLRFHRTNKYHEVAVKRRTHILTVLFIRVIRKLPQLLSLFSKLESQVRSLWVRCGRAEKWVTIAGNRNRTVA